MNSINFPLLIISLTTLLASCTKDEPLSMRWDLTACFNPWDSYFSLDTFSTDGYIAGVNDYLSEEGIEVNYITSDFDSSKVELCFACHCKTGTVIVINIPTKDRRKLKNLAPNNQFDLSFY
ncbi:MAG: hypothetical protein ISR00_00850 [Flavobacteriales bacterium]|nr:hypothetical protein [Flavobacteriales bacterium]MBL6872481.1 hypothetical protein [Flavobacteriales bacterium]